MAPRGPFFGWGDVYEGTVPLHLKAGQRTSSPDGQVENVAVSAGVQPSTYSTEQTVPKEAASSLSFFLGGLFTVCRDTPGVPWRVSRAFLLEL